MRRAALLLSLAAAGLSLGCLHNAPEFPLATEPQLLSRIQAADPRAAAQMLDGFYPLEQRLWSWTTKEFAVSLAPPRPVADLPAELALRFTLPEVIIERLGPITLTARIDGAEIGSQIYDTPGVGLLFNAEVPDALLVTDETVVEFELDKSMMADEEPIRELGIVFLSAALQ